MAYFNLDLEPIRQRCRERGDVKHVRCVYPVCVVRCVCMCVYMCVCIVRCVCVCVCVWLCMPGGSLVGDSATCTCPMLPCMLPCMECAHVPFRVCRRFPIHDFDPYDLKLLQLQTRFGLRPQVPHPRLRPVRPEAQAP